MTVTDSRLKAGALTIGGKDYACQATNVRIVPSHEDKGDPVETLCGDTLAAAATRRDTLAITSVQDFTDPAGFVAMTWTDDLTTVAFTWKPEGATGPTYSGNVEVRAVEVGGPVGERLTTDAEWSCVGPVTVTYPQT